MRLDRVIGLIIFLICLLYGHEAFVTMEAGLLPFERSMAFLPNSLPKALSVLGAIVALVVVVTTPARTADGESLGDLDYRLLAQYRTGQALALLGLMVAYALLLRPFGFLASTFLFLAAGSLVLGERHYHRVALASALGAVIVWYLVQEVLGIFLRPLPWFLSTGG